MQKVNSDQKSTVNRSKSTGWRQQADQWWRQQMITRWHKQVTSARADVRDDVSKLPGGVWGAWINFAKTLTGAWRHVNCPMMPFLRRWWRSKKDDSYGVGGNKTEDTLVAREARGSTSPKLWPARGGAWMVRCGCFWRRCVGRLNIYPMIGLMS